MEIQGESTRRRTCATYAGDMHALEMHMLEAFERQVSITKEVSDANALVLALIATSKRHARILNDLVSSLGDVEKIVTDKLKSAFAGLFGVAAGLVDTVRPLSVSKALRDDYTAVNHAIVGYVLLSTTASALKNEETRIIADEFLNDYIDLAQKIMGMVPALALRDLAGEGIQLLDFNAATSFRSNKQWNSLFSRELTQATSATGTTTGITGIATSVATTTTTTAINEAIIAPNTIIVEKTTVAQPATVGIVSNATVRTIVKPVIVEETFRPEKIIEVQPIVHREVQAPEVHHIERHIYEKVEATGPTIITNKPIIQEIIKPQIIEEVQEIVHRELPAPFVERVEKHIDEVEVMPTLHTKEVILDKEAHIKKAEIIVEETVAVAPVAVVAPAAVPVAVVEKKITTETTVKPAVAAGGHIKTL